MWASALLRPCLLVPRGLARRGLGLGGPAPLAAARGLFNNTAANATPATPATSHATHSHAGHGATSSAGLNSRHLSHSSSCSAGAGSSSGRGADDATYTTTTTTAATAATATANRNDAGTISDAEWAEVVELLGAMAATKGRPNAPGGWRDAYEYMPVHLQRVGLTPERLASLNFIHVAGTKGKGSTCAMVESLLRAAGYRTGLYTSPHLVDVRERLRLDGRMLPRAEFAASFWRVYGALSTAAARDAQAAATAAAAGGGGGSPASGQVAAVGMPSFFSFMTIMAMDAFLARPPELRPQVVVLEVGIGGRLDATNAVVGPRGCSLAAAAVTSLGFDHMELLGDTLPKIAREKAGVMKPGRPVLAVPQPEEAMAALQEVADRVGASLSVPPPLERYSLAAGAGSSSSSSSSAPDLVGLGGEHMRLNASLAVALAAEWERQYGAAATAAAAAAASGAGAGAVAAAAAAAAGRALVLLPGGPKGADATARAAAVR
ncbi:hypothetical protein CHLRE_05g239067v5 [Chlamydomonas reinhardtii]|uniref:Uncharacterized protein n=1 Tax=Chlamydomonas reinhardtii TaxID=3055 RepID=A0A2K3DT28_CHLRE|nr:uncharacterized protein CHLRE_05g239067v5 [Chlamydomonas reinhardtii]PNW83681.1 hypothetical protein CHLRE_05g239067v5 [Chlamydomonas reinhardtii]